VTKHITKTALSIAPDSKKPWKTRLIRAGQEVELSGEVAESLIERGGLVDPNADKKDEDVAPAATGRVADPDNPDPRDDVVLPERPSNGASTDSWRTYADELNRVTSTEMDPMEIPADAKRDQLIAVTDQRVKDWNED
jgi:hypothetical protein